MTLRGRASSLALPDIYVVLFGFILVVAALTWIVPAGSYERAVLPNGRESVVAGSYHVIEQTPVGFMDIVTAIPVGLSDASSVVFLTLLVGGSVGVLRRTGVIDLGIGRLMTLLRDRVELLIPALMGVFGLIAAFIGTPELGIAYLPIVLPLMLRLGYDSVTAAAMVLLSSTLGYAFGITAPSTIGIGHMLAELPMFSGAWYRALSFLVIQLFSIAFVMRYARRVHAHPESRLNADVDEVLRTELAAEGEPAETFTERQSFAALGALVMFVAIVVAILQFGLGFNEISGLFVAMAVVTSVVAGHAVNDICRNFNSAFKEMLVGALIVGVARGVSVIMVEGNILDTFVFHIASLVDSLPEAFTAVGILLTQTVFNFLVPSGSGQCLITLPILIPMADLVGLTRQVVVLATHWGDGITNILFPTSGYFVATLAIGRVSFVTWLKFYWPFFWIVLATAIIGVIVAQSIALGPF